MVHRVHDVKNWDEFQVISFKPKDFGEYDVDIKIEYCGVCASDVRSTYAIYSAVPNSTHIGAYNHGRVGKSNHCIILLYS